MIDRKKLDQMEEHGGAAALKYRDELGNALQTAVNNTVKAVSAYFDDARDKRAAIADRVAALRDECSRLDEQISDFGPSLAQATIAGDRSALDTIQRDLAELETNRAATVAQIDLLEKVQIRGDEDLYRKAREAAKEMERVNRETMADLSALSTFADKQIDLWRQVPNFSMVSGNTVPLRSVLSRVEDMQRDYEGEEE